MKFIYVILSEINVASRMCATCTVPRVTDVHLSRFKISFCFMIGIRKKLNDATSCTVGPSHKHEYFFSCLPCSTLSCVLLMGYIIFPIILNLLRLKLKHSVLFLKFELLSLQIWLKWVRNVTGSHRNVKVTDYTLVSSLVFIGTFFNVYCSMNDHNHKIWPLFA